MVYTDKIHLVADSLDELHRFSISIGLKRHFFEGVRKGHPHYDLTNEAIREKAFAAGALLVSKREILLISKALSKSPGGRERPTYIVVDDIETVTDGEKFKNFLNLIQESVFCSIDRSKCKYGCNDEAHCYLSHKPGL